MQMTFRQQFHHAQSSEHFCVNTVTSTCYRPSRVLTFKINRLRFLLWKPQVGTWMRSVPPGASLSWNLWLWNKRKAQFSTGWAVKDFSWLCHTSLRSSLITNTHCQLKTEAVTEGFQITPNPVTVKVTKLSPDIGVRKRICLFRSYLRGNHIQ